MGCFTAVTGISGSGKSSLVSQALLELVGAHLGHAEQPSEPEAQSLEDEPEQTSSGHVSAGLGSIKRLVQVDQKPIGRTPRSNLATYTGLFDHVRKCFAATEQAKAQGFDAGRFSFNVAKGRCANCEGEGFVSVELLFMPSVYAPCPTCQGARYNPETLAVSWQGMNIAQVLQLTVDQALQVLPSNRLPAVACRCCRISAWATCVWANRPPSCPVVKRSGSSWRPSCSAWPAGRPCMCWMSPPTACTRRTSTGCWYS